MTKANIQVGMVAHSGKIELDGVDISTSVRSFTLSADVREVTVLTLTMFPRATVLDAEVEVRLNPETADFLKRLGWTPPPWEGQ